MIFSNNFVSYMNCFCNGINDEFANEQRLG